MINCFGPELEILLNFDLKKATITADSRIIEGIKRVRKGELIIKPGFDGQYGEISIFFEKDRASKQKVLFK
jgi:PHP family Zn ribbon phosphoesterase